MGLRAKGPHAYTGDYDMTIEQALWVVLIGIALRETGALWTYWGR